MARISLLFALFGIYKFECSLMKRIFRYKKNTEYGNTNFNFQNPFVGITMSLLEQQLKFTLMVAKLINFAYENGFELTLGDAARMDNKGHKQGSFHYKRLAIDLNLFKNGKYLDKTEDHQMLGEFWKSIGGSWGGDWSDGNHFSYGEK